MDVIPLILSEEAVRHLDDDMLYQIAECSTTAVKSKVDDYLSSDDADPQVKEKVARAFSNYIGLKEFFESEKTLDCVNLIKDLDYTSIGPSLDTNTLKSYSEAIEYILSNKYAVPYLKPITNDGIKVLQASLAQICKSSETDRSIKDLANNLKRFSSMFRDPQHSTYKGTVVKKIIRNKAKYEVINKGISFIITKKQAGALPSQWRFL